MVFESLRRFTMVFESFTLLLYLKPTLAVNTYLGRGLVLSARAVK